MTLSTRVAHNTIIQIAGKIISTIIGLFAIAIMARYLREAGFGQYTTVMTFLSLFGIVADFGLTLVTSQMTSQPRADQDILLNNLFSLRLVSAVIFLGLAPLLVWFFPYDFTVKLGVAIASLSFFFVALSQILVGWFQKNLTMTAVAISEIAGRLMLLGGIILTAYFNLSLISILITTVISSLVSFLVQYWFSRRFIKINWQVNFAVWSEIIKKSWPLGFTIVFNLIYLKADTLILSLLKSQSQVGIYGATYKIIDVLTTLPFMFAGLVLPLLTVSWANRDSERFNRILQKSLDVMILSAMPLIIGAQIVAKPLMVLIAGENFSPAGPVLKILILAIGFIFLGCLFAHAVIALDKQKKMIGAYIFTAVTSLVGYAVFIPIYSYYGAAWVTVYSELIIGLFSLHVVLKYSLFKPDLKMIYKSAAAALIMALAAYGLVGKINLIIAVLLSGLIYLICLYLFKGLNREDLKNLIADQ